MRCSMPRPDLTRAFLRSLDAIHLTAHPIDPLLPERFDASSPYLRGTEDFGDHPRREEIQKWCQ